MTRPALVAIRGDYHDIGEVLQRQRECRQTIGLVAVIIAKQYSQEALWAKRMTKKTKHSNSDDTALFRETIGEVRPITGSRRVAEKSRPKPHAKFSRAREPTASDAPLTDELAPPDIEIGAELNFHRSQVTRKTLRQLRRGQIAIQEEIDLHGMTSQEARVALRDFITECHSRRLGCVRVIHGKGLGSGPRGPVLKAGVNHWLSQWDEIAAFCSAQPQHGGTGAVYVLLI